MNHLSSCYMLLLSPDGHLDEVPNEAKESKMTTAVQK